ncbi:hypothetical protein MASR2M47_44430 [Draconibacterium sp.]|jgi:hypothetical protein
MKLPFLNIFKSQKKSIPDKVKSLFADKFPDAKNIEWEKKVAVYEAIFYLNDIEHIARFSENGLLVEYRKNLWPDELPENIKTTGSTFGETMNGIIIYRGEEILYELIIRDEKLDRYEYLFDKNGEVLKSELL